jgi:hypothetical protein
MTETTKIMTKITKMTKTLVAIKHLGDVAMSNRKKIANYGNIQMRSRQERKRPTRASLITVQRDASTITLRNSSSNTSLSARKEVTKI